jgi:guanosine-3',5'-bis(diphosphate) 3'-pyrophosphohydrolase
MMNDDLVLRARRFSVQAHAGQTRDNGADYATHPHAVAELLRARGVSDPVILAAAYLHDVIEDTDIEAETLQREFGKEVADVVLELTCRPPRGAAFEAKQALLVEHCRQMSPRARHVKLADRRHNLSEMGAWPEWKQQRYARAALELLEALRPWPDAQLADEIQRTAQRVVSAAG